MLSVMFPALNEERNLRAAVMSVIEVARELDIALDVIIVDDGSTDGTAAVIEELGREFPFVRSITHEQNLGIGESFRHALAAASGDKFTGFASDNNVSPITIRNLLENHRRADVVITYMINTEERGMLRHVISMLFSIIYVLSFNIHVKYINGNTVWPTALLRSIPIHARNYSIMAEVNTRVLRSPVTFLEVVGYLNPRPRKSYALRWRNLIEVVGIYFRLLWEVHVSQRERYATHASRIILNGGR